MNNKFSNSLPSGFQPSSLNSGTLSPSNNNVQGCSLFVSVIALLSITKMIIPLPKNLTLPKLEGQKHELVTLKLKTDKPRAPKSKSYHTKSKPVVIHPAKSDEFFCIIPKSDETNANFDLPESGDESDCDIGRLAKGDGSSDRLPKPLNKVQPSFKTGSEYPELQKPQQPLKTLKQRQSPKSPITSVRLHKSEPINGIFVENFDGYCREMGKITKKNIPSNQKKLLMDFTEKNDIQLLSNKEIIEKRKEYNNRKSYLIQQWQDMTNRPWPRYEKDVCINGKIERFKGQAYDVHHIIELSYGGPNVWFNLHPARFPDEHQDGIHAKGSVASLIFGGIPEKYHISA